MVLPPANEIMAIIKTRTPMPPIQWVKLRQKRIDSGWDSTSVITEKPVVVNPDTDSNKASKKEGIEPLRKKGKEPIIDKNIQAKATMIKPSVAYIAFFCGRRLIKKKARAAAMAIATIKENAHEFSP
jgi:hypothetical protein